MPPAKVNKARHSRSPCSLPTQYTVIQGQPHARAHAQGRECMGEQDTHKARLIFARTAQNGGILRPYKENERSSCNARRLNGYLPTHPSLLSLLNENFKKFNFDYSQIIFL